MKTFSLIFSFLIISISSCSSGGEKQKEKSVVQPEAELPVFENFSTGQVIDKVTCKADTNQSYALYLPENYDSKKRYPVIYAFDPHKTGKLPVANYKDLAEKYGYIIIGSNNSQNGLEWQQSQSIATAMFNDSRNRIAINTDRIYLAGFSGGARIANALCMLNGSFKGVICCGAASPAVNVPDPRDNYTFFGIAGNEDFNYSEMKKYDLLDLAGRRLKHTLITFDGKHEWPPAAAMEQAFLWLELNNMRTNPAEKNDSLIAKNLADESAQLNTLLKEHKDYEAYELCRRVINYYESLGDLKLFFDTYTKLKNSPETDKKLKQNEAEMQREEKLKAEYINNFQVHDFVWWQKEIASINQQIKSGKDKNEALIKKRLLSYLSLVCYMQTDGGLKQNNLQAAEYFGKLYILVDPTNSEAYYLMAVIAARNGNDKRAVNYLKDAAKCGLKDSQRIEAETAFIKISESSEYKEILGKIKTTSF
jgi:hypothetical protein